MQQDGRIESFDVSLLSPNGEMDGFIIDPWQRRTDLRCARTKSSSATRSTPIRRQQHPPHRRLHQRGDRDPDADVHGGDQQGPAAGIARADGRLAPCRLERSRARTRRQLHRGKFSCGVRPPMAGPGRTKLVPDGTGQPRVSHEQRRHPQPHPSCRQGWHARRPGDLNTDDADVLAGRPGRPPRPDRARVGEPVAADRPRCDAPGLLVRKRTLRRLQLTTDGAGSGGGAA